MSRERDLDVTTVERWRAVAPRRWTSRWPLLACWVVLFVVSTVVSKEGGCTVAHPCATVWGNSVDGALVVAAPVLVLWMPRAGVLASLAAVLSYLLVELRLDDIPHAVVAVLSAAVLVATAVLQVQLSGRRQAEEKLAAGVAKERWPGPTALPGASGLGRFLGAALVLV